MKHKKGDFTMHLVICLILVGVLLSFFGFITYLSELQSEPDYELECEIECIKNGYQFIKSNNYEGCICMDQKGYVTYIRLNKNKED